MKDENMSYKDKYEMTETPPNSTMNSSENIMAVEMKTGEENQGFTGSDQKTFSEIELDPPYNVNSKPNGYPDKKAVMAMEGSRYSRGVYFVQSHVQEFYMDHEAQVWFCIKIIFAVAYFVYFGFAMAYSFGDEGSIRLLVVTILVTLFIVTRMLCHYCEDGCMMPYRRIKSCFKSMSASQKKNYARFMTWFYTLFMVGYAIFIIVWVIVDVGLVNPENLISGAGVAVFILTFYVTSHNPAAVKWRPVLWGLYIQFAFALLILRWEIGFKAFSWLGDRVQEFLAHTDAGAIFVFGDSYTNHFFAFKGPVPQSDCS